MSVPLPQFLEDLYLALSHDRLEAHRYPKGASDLEMVTNYFWNIDLSEALFPCLHALELTLRNSIHNVFTEYYGTDMWFYYPGLLESGQLNQVALALRDAAKKPPLLSGKMVAALSFGFWVALLSDRYQRPIWQQNGYQLFQAVFPHASGPDFQRHLVHARLDRIRLLRNRVFHHEKIFHRTSLYQEHLAIHELIGWINPTMQSAILAVDDFDAIFNSRAQVEANLRLHLRLA